MHNFRPVSLVLLTVAVVVGLSFSTSQARAAEPVTPASSIKPSPAVMPAPVAMPGPVVAAPSVAAPSVAAPSASARRHVLPRRAKLRKAQTFALDIVRIPDSVFSVSYGVPLRMNVEAGGVFAAGSPTRARLDRFNITELGGYVSWFAMGDRVKGVGLTARARYLYAWGEGADDSGGPITTSAHAVAGSGLITARYTTLNGLRVELQGGLMWLRSRATATSKDAEQTSTLNAPLTTFSMLVGWTF